MIFAFNPVFYIMNSYHLGQEFMRSYSGEMVFKKQAYASSDLQVANQEAEFAIPNARASTTHALLAQAIRPYG